MFLNADASDGEIRVEVQKASGEPVAGYAMADCRPVRGDGISQQVRFAPGADESQIVRRPIRLRVRARKSDLYSIWMPNGETDPHYWNFREIRCVDPMRDLELPS
jgi:hypothetical protein